MKSINFKKILPHIIAIIIFLLLSIFITKPSLEGKVVQQHDVIQWKAMAQQSLKFNEQYGHFPKWTNSMFGGMPTFTIAFGPQKPNYIHIGYVEDLFTLGLPKPVYYLFIASLCFYILSLTIGANPWISILGGIAYAYCSYNPILIAVGHDTKLMSMAYAPAVLTGILLIFKQRYWLGAAVLLVFGLLLMSQMHQQIVYYTLLMAIFMTIHFIIKCIKEKKIRHLLLSGLINISVGALMLATLTLSYWSIYDFSKETMRGGVSELTKENKNNTTKGGLDKDYAFQYSYGKAETMTLLVPNAAGGGSAEGLGDESKAIEVLQENAAALPNGFAQQIAQASPMYWGELLSTSGTVYIGGIVCLLFLLAAFLSKSEHKWWLLSLTIFGIILAWGKNFETINYFLFDNLPFYKKFRAPSMALVIPQLSIPLLAVVFLNEFIKTDKEKLKVLIKKCAYIFGGVIVFLFLFYFFADFTNSATTELSKNIKNFSQGQLAEFSRNYFTALKQDRQAFYLKDMWRTIGFIFIAFMALFLYAKKIIKPAFVYSILIIFTIIDLYGIGIRYLNEENFIDPVDYEAVYADNAADLAIKKDKGFFRVCNLAFPSNGSYVASINNSFNDAIASYKHNTIGGYNAAKLSIYQDIIENQLYKNIESWAANPLAKDSFPVLNMLNTKYIIVPDNNNPTQTQAITNKYALGNCWLVKEIKFVKNADEEMAALNSFDPENIAIVDERFKTTINLPIQYDSSAYIKLIENKNDEIKYEFKSNANQFAVFSEVYYSRGWNAYIDGKKAPYARVNYALRGLNIPAGSNIIEFKFEPIPVSKGEYITRFANIVSALFLLLCIFMVWKKKEYSIIKIDK